MSNGKFWNRLFLHQHAGKMDVAGHGGIHGTYLTVYCGFCVPEHLGMICLIDILRTRHATGGCSSGYALALWNMF
jgi:hypothetical protein